MTLAEVIHGLVGSFWAVAVVTAQDSAGADGSASRPSHGHCRSQAPAACRSHTSAPHQVGLALGQLTGCQVAFPMSARRRARRRLQSLHNPTGADESLLPCAVAHSDHPWSHGWEEPHQGVSAGGGAHCRPPGRGSHSWAGLLVGPSSGSDQAQPQGVTEA